MAKSLLQILFSFVFWREKKSKSRFWSDGTHFLDLVDFFLKKKSTGSWDFSSLSFDKRPLNVGRHVLNVLY